MFIGIGVAIISGLTGSYPLDMLKCYRAKSTRADDSQNSGGGAPKKGLKKFISDAENYLHPNKTQYEADTTDNLGDAENPLHRVTQ